MKRCKITGAWPSMGYWDPNLFSFFLLPGHHKISSSALSCASCHDVLTHHRVKARRSCDREWEILRLVVEKVFGKRLCQEVFVTVTQS